MSSGRAVEKPRPIFGLAWPVTGSSGMTSSSHFVCRASSRVISASALLQTPSWFESSRSRSSHGFAATVQTCVTAFAVGKSPASFATMLTSFQSQPAVLSVLVSQTAASANARTTKRSLPSSPSSRSSAWFE